jgi:hypothetical protein
MTKEQELMRYLHKKVFDPILDSPDAPSNIKSGVNLTIARMSRLSAEKMVQYFWSAPLPLLPSPGSFCISALTTVTLSNIKSVTWGGAPL